MKKISFFLLLMFLLGHTNSIIAQVKTVKGKLDNRVWVEMEYVYGGDTKTDKILSLKYDGVDLIKKISDMDDQIKKLRGRIDVLEKGPKTTKDKKTGSKTDTAQERRMWVLQRDNHIYQLQMDSLSNQVQLLMDSIHVLEKSVYLLKDSVELLKDSLLKMTNVVVVHSEPSRNQHVGVYGSIGVPWLMNELLSPKNGESPIWSRQMTFSHQIGVYWGSRSLLRNFPLSLGVGLEYSRVLLVAGMGHYYKAIDSIDNVPIVDIDSDNYTARLTLLDVKEKATLRYLSIPLTLSIGQPYCDRISGYAQITVALSLCLKSSSSLSTTGNYNLEGYYSDWHLTLTEFPRLGFGSDQRIEEKKEELKVNGVLFTGRLAGGVYVPLCRIKQHETSPWVLKLGVKLDYSISPAAKKAEQEDKPSRVVFNATDYITQNNFLSGGRFSFLNPGVEVGIMYIFGTKNR